MSAGQWPQINAKRSEATPVTPGEGQLGSDSLIFQPSLPMMVAGGLVFSEHPAQPVFNWLAPPVQQTRSFWDQQDTISAIFAPEVDDPDLDSSITSRMKYFAFHMAPAEWAEQYRPDRAQPMAEPIPASLVEEFEEGPSPVSDLETATPTATEASRETAPTTEELANSGAGSHTFQAPDSELVEPIEIDEVTDLSSDWELTGLDEFAATLAVAEELLSDEQSAADLVHHEPESLAEELLDETTIPEFTTDFAEADLDLDASPQEEPIREVEQTPITWAPPNHHAADFTVTTPARTWEPRDHDLLVSISITEGFSWLSQFHLLATEVCDDVVSTVIANRR